MFEQNPTEQIREAVDARLSGLQGDPWLAQRVLANAKGEEKVKKKLSVGFVLVIVLVLAAVTALAVTLLSATKIVQEEVLPLAIHNDETTIQEDFTNEELVSIANLAQENNIALSQNILNALQGGYGYSEQSIIMELATSEFGPYDEWTIEQQYWFGEVMVAIGWQEINSCCLPEEKDISYEQALKLANDYVVEAYGHSILDKSVWKQSVSYKNSSSSGGSPMWRFDFLPRNPQDNQFNVMLEADGTLVYCEIRQMETAYGSSIIEAYEVSYGPYANWTPEIWAAFGADIKTAIPDSNPAWVFLNTEFILPPSGGITQNEAEKIALEAQNAEYTSVGSAVCCMDRKIPIWKIVTHIQFPQDIGSGKYSSVWVFEINALSGEIHGQREFMVGKNKDYLTQWVPWAVYEELPERPDILKYENKEE